MSHSRLGLCLGAALVAVLLAALGENPARPAAAPKEGPRLRLAPGGEFQIDDLQVSAAAVIDEKALVLVGTRRGPEDADPDSLEPNGAILDLGTKKARRFTNGHTARICGVAIRRGRIATTSIRRDPALRIWDLKAGKTVRQVSIDKVLEDAGYTREDPYEGTEQSVAWFHKSETLAVASDEYVLLLDAARPDKSVGVLRIPRPAGGWAHGPAAISPDDAWVACPIGQGPRGKARVVFWEVKTGKATEVSLTPSGVEKPEQWSADGAFFGPEGRLFAWRSAPPGEVPEKVAEKDVPAARRGVVRIDVPGGKVVPLGMGQGIYTLHCAIDPTGKWLAVAGTSREPGDDVRVYHLPSGKLACRLGLKGENPPKWVAFTPSGKRLVCATLYGLVRWWDLREK
jgi:hypothetical protein